MIAAIDVTKLWAFLPIGFALTIAIEIAVLMVGLSSPHTWRTRLLAGVWLTACTYPIVVLVMPLWFEERWLYLTVAETFAPLAECALFAIAMQERELTATQRTRDFVAIIIANLASFLIGMLIFK